MKPTVCEFPRLPSNENIKFPNYLITAIETFRDCNRDIKTRTSSLRLVERYLVEKGSCDKINPKIMENFRLRLFSIDDEKLDTLLNTEVATNANIHDDISCAIDAIIYHGKCLVDLHHYKGNELEIGFQ